MNLDSLLNHDAPAQRRRPSSSASAQHDHDQYQVKVTTYEAASALTALATLGPGQQYAPDPSRELPSPTAFSHPRRTSSFGSQSHITVAVAPVEPSPPLDQPQAHSPTLAQYHHGSKSPEEQRRQSLLVSSPSPANVLAPIQSLTGVLQEHTQEPQQDEEPQQEEARPGEPLPEESKQLPEEAPDAQPAPTYGTDVSQTVLEDDSARDSTQNREPAFVRDEPTVSQIRAAEPADADTPQSIATHIPLPHDAEAPLPAIKDEPAGTPRDATPPTATAVMQSSEQQPVSVDSVDDETRKAIEAVKQNDLGLRNKRNASVAETVASPESKTTAAPSKKRPAPAIAAIKKKGTAALKKPSAKKRKLDEPDTTARSATPTSRAAKQAQAASVKGGRKGSQAGTPVAESSPAPDYSSQIHVSDEEAESSDDNTLYCICRKPDNHRWMIGCDGGCDDWFHGSCVDMVQSDEDLVDKFICPNCEAAGRGQTTWKPVCRRDGCRKPARLIKGKESKYCSEECGVLFFQANLQRTAGAQKAKSKKAKKKPSSPLLQDGRASSEEEEPTPLGGVIRAKDVKALAVASKDIETFKRLGSGVLSPPHTASPTRPSFDGNGATPTTNGINPEDDLPYTPSEREHLAALRGEKAQLKIQLEVLKDREKFVSMAREQASRFAEREKIKSKEFCGYDVRLSWSDAEFLRWRESPEGRAAFRCNTLTPTDEQIESFGSVDSDGDVSMVNGVGVNGTAVMVNGDGIGKVRADTVCTKKRCGKHPQWQKLNLQDARFEELEVVEAIKQCEKDERNVRERARRRAQKEDVEKDVMGGESGGVNGDAGNNRNREGWAEVVEGS